MNENEGPLMVYLSPEIECEDKCYQGVGFSVPSINLMVFRGVDKQGTLHSFIDLGGNTIEVDDSLMFMAIDGMVRADEVGKEMEAEDAAFMTKMRAATEPIMCKSEVLFVLDDFSAGWKDQPK